jgi:RNA-directed DNA polymerase
VDQAIKEGYRYVVDADIRAYFDNIDHERLMADVRESIADGRVLALIEAFLKQDVLEAMKAWTPESGTPQGAVISPLLANLYLNGLDHAMAKAGYLMIRYADDFVVLCRSRKEAEQALELVGHQVDQRGLSLHPEKTHVVDLEEAGAGFDFLGYHFTRTKHWPRKKSLKKAQGCDPPEDTTHERREPPKDYYGCEPQPSWMDGILQTLPKVDVSPSRLMGSSATAQYSA